MRMNKFFLIAIATTTLISCNNGLSSSSIISSSTSSSSFISSSSEHESSSESSSSEPEVDLESFAIEDKETTSVVKNENGKYVLDFYCINDFHGAVATNNDDEPGITRISSYLKSKRQINPGGTYIFSSGDMWQGSADSNLTKGKLVTECMNSISFDAMCIGNHEFDWGFEDMDNNINMMEFPFLACNVLDKTTNKIWDKTIPYSMIERKDFKIGVIGSIEQGITSSILPSRVENYEFVDPTSYVIEASNTLRSSGADLIIYLTHGGKEKVRSTINDYVDVVFGGHEHNSYATLVDGVPYLQGGENGKYISHVSFEIDEGKINKTLVNYETIKSSKSIISLKEEHDVYYIYQDYYQSYIKDIKEEVLCEIDEDINEYNAKKLIVNVMNDKYRGYEPSLVGSIHNNARGSFKKGIVIYGDVYIAFPFDNYMHIITVKGNTLKRMMKKGYYEFNISDKEIKSDYDYKICTIDYILEDFKNEILEDIVFEDFARDILADYFRSLRNV